jgi:hypothetical protein
MSGQRLCLLQRLELNHLAFGTQALDPVRSQHGDACRIVAAVFERLQAGDEMADDVAPRTDSNDSTHVMILIDDRRGRSGKWRADASGRWQRAEGALV